MRGPVRIARLTRLTGEPDGIRARMLAEAAAVPVRIALNTWADSVEAGRPVDLLGTYARCRAQMRQALGEPAPI
ncbi:hypothetical protein GCM10022223_67010 [Kineosporia mesophila]|uniref:Uncharacterized protein n=1 Tax=Kineosporia mesophila TaxID=566012 RepID=A0ABP7ARJ0_9ACTN|nr:hypothetical protein [Kineosporia mesophila]MCD5349057.1 hypothetical protein [Kineosporia mesophila]